MPADAEQPARARIARTPRSCVEAWAAESNVGGGEADRDGGIEVGKYEEVDGDSSKRRVWVWARARQREDVACGSVEETHQDIYEGVEVK
jgi:hypothetical protein